MNIYLEKFINKKFKKPGKVLDLGAGDFADVAYLKKIGWKCEGVDIKTGINLEKLYISKNKPFDLVYSNYVLQKIENKDVFIKTIYDNLKEGGYFFIHTFDESSPISSNGIKVNFLKKLLKKQGFINVKIKTFSHYDKEHKHWHVILEVIGQK